MDEKTVIVAFRMLEKDVEELNLRVKTNKLINVRSSNQLARKIVLDYLDGKLVYAPQKEAPKIAR